MRKIIFTIATLLCLSTTVNAKSNAEIKREWKGFVEKRMRSYKADINEVLPVNTNKVFRMSKDTYVYKDLDTCFEVIVEDGDIVSKKVITDSKFKKSKKLCLMRITKFWLKKNRLQKSDLLSRK